MNKEKLLKAGMWLSVTVLIIAVDAILLFLGFNHLKHDSYTVIIIAVCLLPVLFLCAYKGIISLLDAIFS